MKKIANKIGFVAGGILGVLVILGFFAMAAIGMQALYYIAYDPMICLEEIIGLAVAQATICMFEVILGIVFHVCENLI